MTEMLDAEFTKSVWTESKLGDSISKLIHKRSH